MYGCSCIIVWVWNVWVVWKCLRVGLVGGVVGRGVGVWGGVGVLSVVKKVDKLVVGEELWGVGWGVGCFDCCWNLLLWESEIGSEERVLVGVGEGLLVIGV